MVANVYCTSLHAFPRPHGVLVRMCVLVRMPANVWMLGRELVSVSVRAHVRVHVRACARARVFTRTRILWCFYLITKFE